MTLSYNSLTKLLFCNQSRPTTTKLPQHQTHQDTSPEINYDKVATNMTQPSPGQLNKQRINHIAWQSHHNDKANRMSKQPTMTKAPMQSNDKTNMKTTK